MLEKIFNRTRLQTRESWFICTMYRATPHMYRYIEGWIVILKNISYGVESKHWWVDSYTLCINPYHLCPDTLKIKLLFWKILQYVSTRRYDVSTYLSIFHIKSIPSVCIDPYTFFSWKIIIFTCNGQSNLILSVISW